MNGRILGFHRLARWPKWTPASIRSFTWTIATHCPPAPKVGKRGNLGGHDTLAVLPIVGFPPTRGKGVIVPPAGEGVKGFLGEKRRGVGAPIAWLPRSAWEPGTKWVRALRTRFQRLRPKHTTVRSSPWGRSPAKRRTSAM